MPEPLPGTDQNSLHITHNEAATNNIDNGGFELLKGPASHEPPLPFPLLCARLHDRIQQLLAEKNVSERVRRVQQQCRISLGVLSEALDRYSLYELSLSYNGGKDCLVLLVLYLAAIHAKGLATTATKDVANHTNNHAIKKQSSTIQCVYIQAKDPFQEVEEFVESNTKTYSLDLVRYAKPMKDAFADYLADYPKVQAILVGTRRTDPHGGSLTFFDRTDHGWPDFMRIHPVIDWHYVDIWTFIRHLHIPYCVLYDRGYTSLGGTGDTHPNPALRRNPETSNGAGQSQFRPAYELMDDDEERLGRDR